MGPFFSRLSYSFGNEDWKTEQQALQVKKGDRVLCITGSGDRPLHFLLGEPGEVISVDANIYQTQLLLLKSAALQALDYPRYLSFLGARKAEARLSLFSELFPYLSPQSVQFWNGNLRMVSKGVLYEGCIEKCCQFLAAVIKRTRKEKLEQLFAFTSIEEQRKFLESEWESRGWKAAFSFVLHPWLTRFTVKDPSLYAHLGENIHPATYIRERMNEGLSRHLAKDSLLTHLAFQGKVPESAFPPYLQEEGAQEIKTKVSRLKTHTGDLLNYLEGAPSGSFDVFSLSNVASYLSEADFSRLARAMVRTAKPGARFCMRQLMSNYAIPKELIHHFKRDEQLEEKLNQEDNCFVYRFTVGEITP